MKKKFLNFKMISDDKTAKIYLYGEIEADSENGVNSEDIVSQLNDLSGYYDNIEIHINSKGGDVFEGIAIFNAIKDCKANITIYVDAVAASMAAVIALCGKPVYMSKNACIMLHNISGGCYGNKDAIKTAYDLITTLEDSFSTMLSKKCGMSKSEFQSTYFDGNDHWLTASDCVKKKIVDGFSEDNVVVPNPADQNQVYNFYNNRLSMLFEGSQNKKDMAFIDDLKKIPQFSNCADEQAILQKIQELNNGATRSATLEKALNDANAQLKIQHAEANKLIIDNAIAEGKLQETQRETFDKLLDADKTSALALLNGIKGKQANVKDFLGGGGANNQNDELLTMSWDTIDKANRLPELKEKFPEVYQQKFDEKFKK